VPSADAEPQASPPVGGLPAREDAPAPAAGAEGTSPETGASAEVRQSEMASPGAVPAGGSGVAAPEAGASADVGRSEMASPGAAPAPDAEAPGLPAVAESPGVPAPAEDSPAPATEPALPTGRGLARPGHRADRDAGRPARAAARRARLRHGRRRHGRRCGGARGRA
jgi:hypothetical protein